MTIRPCSLWEITGTLARLGRHDSFTWEASFDGFARLYFSDERSNNRKAWLKVGDRQPGLRGVLALAVAPGVFGPPGIVAGMVAVWERVATAELH